MSEPKQKYAEYVLVTGATRGIGRAVAERFVRAGFGLLTCGRSADRLAVLRTDLTRAFPGVPVHTFVADLSDPVQTAAFGRWVTDELRLVPKILVHNTGIFEQGGVLTEPAGTLRRLFETNVASVYDLSRLLLPPMITRGTGGLVITLCSIASLIAYPNGGSYCITKFALLGLTKVLREELKPAGIRVTAILPGATLTDSWAGAGLPPERLMPPEDVAEAAWLAWSASPRTVVEEILLRPQLGDV